MRWGLTCRRPDATSKTTGLEMLGVEFANVNWETMLLGKHNCIDPEQCPIHVVIVFGPQSKTANERNARRRRRVQVSGAERFHQRQQINIKCWRQMLVNTHPKWHNDVKIGASSKRLVMVLFCENNTFHLNSIRNLRLQEFGKSMFRDNASGKRLLRGSPHILFLKQAINACIESALAIPQTKLQCPLPSAGRSSTANPSRIVATSVLLEGVHGSNYIVFDANNLQAVSHT